MKTFKVSVYKLVKMQAHILREDTTLCSSLPFKETEHFKRTLGINRLKCMTGHLLKKEREHDRNKKIFNFADTCKPFSCNKHFSVQPHGSICFREGHADSILTVATAFVLCIKKKKNE